MEEIDIIELLKRVKEGKAPKKIEIRGERFRYDDDTDILAYMYENDECNWYSLQITFDTKIKILDKHIINIEEELKKIIKDKDSIFWIGERGLMAIEEAINIIQNKENKE